MPVNPTAPATTPVKVVPPAPSTRPAPPAVPSEPAATFHGDDYAKPGVLGTATTLNSIANAARTPVKVARAARGGAQVGMTTTAGSLSGFLAAFKAGLQANAIMAGALSIVSNGYDALKGRTNMKQFLGLTAADTVAYTAIGAAATATSATFGPMIVGLLPAIPLAGPVIGIGLALAVGIGGSMLYGKLGHEPLKEALR